MWLALLSLCLADERTALVGYRGPQDAERLAAWAAERGALARCLDRTRVCLLDFPGEPPIAELAALPGVRHAERDALIPLAQQASGTDAAGTDDCSDQWELETVRAEEAWTVVTGSGAVVAIADSGFLLTHEEIEDRIASGYDYGDGDDDPEVSWGAGVPGHGTFIAGLIAADGDNEIGRAGLMPDGQLDLLKIADRSGSLYWSYAISALDAMAGAGSSRVLSYSLASTSSSSSFEDAVAALGDADILLVAAAANCAVADCWDGDNDEYPVYPANLDGDHILSVAGTLEDDSLNPYSHRGATTVDLAAPGVDLCSLGVDGDSDYEVGSGTSYATPLVAAAAGLLFEAWPGLSASEAARVLTASVEPVADLDGLVASGGRLDVASALATPVPRFDEPAALVVDGPTTTTWTLRNVAAEGTASMVIFHDASVEFSAASVEGAAWTVERAEPGESVRLPGQTATITAEAAVTVLTGSLPALSAIELDLTVQGAATGETEATARVVARSPSDAVMLAPGDEGSPDLSGEDAWDFAITVTGVPDDDSGEDSGEHSGQPDSGPVDSVDWLGDDSQAPDTRGEGSDKGGSCACSAGDARGHGWALGALAIALAARRRRG